MIALTISRIAFCWCTISFAAGICAGAVLRGLAAERERQEHAAWIESQRRRQSIREDVRWP